MTMPSESQRSLGYAREFLYELLDPKKTPRVARSIRQQAARVLRHYPWSGAVTELYELYRMAHPDDPF